MHNMSGTPSTVISSELRAFLASFAELGSGNFLHVAVERNPSRHLELIFLDRECRTLTGESYTSFSLETLKHVADQYAGWYHSQGVRPRDPVAVYLEEGIENLIHFVALTGLGAIPILINGNMRPHIAAGFIQKVGACALYSDSSHLEAIEPHLTADLKLNFVATDESVEKKGTAGVKLTLPSHYPYRYAEKDVVLVGHSSGTTGIPKAVIFQHQPFFHGIRYRLSLPAPRGGERTLSALPHSHSAGVAYVMLALLSGNKVLVMSNPLADGVLPQVERFRPTMVVAFPQTYVSLAERDLSRHDLSSINLWVNGGDAAHEAHIRKLVQQGSHHDGETVVPGSIFIDGLGSSEMGFSLFRNVHTKSSESYHRCIGAPLDWVAAAALDDLGNELPPFQVGKLGVKAASVTAGYWNESLMTARAQVQGYWLTGDMVYRDEANRFFHVDRVPDVIRTREGDLYSLQTEELLLRHCPSLSDVTVIGVPARGDKESGYLVPVAVVKVRGASTWSQAQLANELDAILETNGKPRLAAIIPAESRALPLGPTGKVLKRELREELVNLFN